MQPINIPEPSPVLLGALMSIFIAARLAFRIFFPKQYESLKEWVGKAISGGNGNGNGNGKQTAVVIDAFTAQIKALQTENIKLIKERDDCTKDRGRLRRRIKKLGGTIH